MCARQHIEARLETIDADLRRSAAPAPTLSAEKIAERVCERLTQLDAQLDSLPPMLLRQLLGTVIRRMVVDLDTRDVEIELALPPSVELPSDDGSLDCSPAYRSAIETTPCILLPRRFLWLGRSYAICEFAA